MSEEIKHAWYSSKQAISAGTAVYSRENGEEIHVTEVSSNSEYGSNFDDAVYLGKVVRFLRQGLRGNSFMEW